VAQGGEVEVSEHHVPSLPVARNESVKAALEEERSRGAGRECAELLAGQRLLEAVAGPDGSGRVSRAAQPAAGAGFRSDRRNLGVARRKAIIVIRRIDGERHPKMPEVALAAGGEEESA